MKKKQKPIIKKRFINIGPLPRALEVSYKNPDILRKFLSDRHKIHPRKLTRVPSSLQRLVTREVKKARIMVLLPFTERHENH
ncbi:30S ribosomal protein S18 [candidate division WWE3 bacterium CG08_land_8_20_14_0_20_40_13]|uniref:Small ribosomal subunit protein bS18 n=1 Tax=candidate division WWE3 bacterium CG08_land_8_20_14_0_20_40_13 TaxID=1975084 RepID=A0A2H0XD65_UNCKA|nr:MAG: 30S ribosomal protein S18 [candidate division WWE3 bacterium CG08_land_8_20_14_0_20_40_13]